MMRFDQVFHADLRRGDGHTTAGRSGDCLRACVATVLQVDPGRLKHYVEYISWYGVLRQDARDMGQDWACTTPELLNPDHGWDIPAGMLMIATGPSPRGAWLHCVVVDDQLATVHDPHPSRAGIDSIVDLLVPVFPYDPMPAFPALTAVAA